MEFLTQTDTWISLATLTAMEVVLGIDNIVFLTILVGKLPPAERARARFLGLLLAMGMRLGLIFAISWVMGLVEPLFTVAGHEISGRDLILLVGGLFLIGKATHEIHDKLEVEHAAEDGGPGRARSSFMSIILQIMVLDLVFSLDSVITAVGMAKHIPVMATAMVIAVVVMMIFAKSIGTFIDRHPTMKILALSFLILIGVLLVADGLGQHVNKGYIYFAMAFALGVEVVNMRIRRKQAAPVTLHHRFEEEEQAGA